MPRKSATVELEAEVQAPNGTHAFRPAPSTRTVIADPSLYPKATGLFAEAMSWMGSDSGFFFEAEIRNDLTWAQLKTFTLNCPWTGVFEQIAPFVVAWNAGAETEDGWQLLPPPAVVGWQVFEQLPFKATGNGGFAHPIAAFLWQCLARHEGGSLPKGLSSSGGMDGGKSDTD